MLGNLYYDAIDNIFSASVIKSQQLASPLFALWTLRSYLPNWVISDGAELINVIMIDKLIPRDLNPVHEVNIEIRSIE